MPKTLKATCSQCGKTYRRSTKGELLNALRKHMWKQHPDYMRKRIKRGMRKHNAKRNNDDVAKQILEALGGNTGILGKLANIGTGVTKEPIASAQRSIAEGVITYLTNTYLR